MNSYELLCIGYYEPNSDPIQNHHESIDLHLNAEMLIEALHLKFVLWGKASASARIETIFSEPVSILTLWNEIYASSTNEKRIFRNIFLNPIYYCTG